MSDIYSKNMTLILINNFKGYKHFQKDIKDINDHLKKVADADLNNFLFLYLVGLILIFLLTFFSYIFCASFFFYSFICFIYCEITLTSFKPILIYSDNS